MDAKTFLRQVEMLDARISVKLAEKNRLWDLATNITPKLRHDAGSGGGARDKTGDVAAKLADLDKEIDSYVDKLIDKKREINAVLEQLEDPDELKILHKKYFEFKTIKTIAEEEHKGFRTVKRKHKSGLCHVDEILKASEKN